ncbi:Ankyrin repeat domain-containing protein 10 [Trichinella papuae]|uniref:Ankyrin repeat domain-containing protein 10 n=1 Tax=Trichinella papuae TaxID=268474 RepID=A0A0V1MVN2_9BILA|nr:Ankyrin repeat domain-containing protein 10 [Trichinella papuae]
MRLPSVDFSAHIDTLSQNGFSFQQWSNECDENILEKLLIYMSDIGQTTVSGPFYQWTAVHWAAFFGRINCLRELLVRHRNLTNRSAGLNRVHPLHCCALGVGCVDCLDTLIAAGAQPNVQDILGETVAHKAARLGRVDFISKLLAIGCDLSVVNWIGLAAAEVAQMQGHTDCAAYAHRSAQLQQQGLFPPYNHHAQNGQHHDQVLNQTHCTTNKLEDMILFLELLFFHFSLIFFLCIRCARDDISSQWELQATLAFFKEESINLMMMHFHCFFFCSVLGVAYERYLHTVKANSQGNPYAYVTGMYGYVPLFSDDTVMEENGKGKECIEQAAVVANGDAIKLLKATAAAGSKRIADADDAETFQAIKRTKWSNGYVTSGVVWLSAVCGSGSGHGTETYPIGRHPLRLTFDLGYEIQQLKHGQVDVAVDQGVVEIVAKSGFQFVALFNDQLQFVVGEIRLGGVRRRVQTGTFPSPGRLERTELRRPDEHEVRLQLGTAEQSNRPRVWIQNANPPLAYQPLDTVQRGAVQVALEFAVLDQPTTADPVFHLSPAGETVLDAVGLAGARRPAGVRYRGGERVRSAGKQTSLQLAATDARRANQHQRSPEEAIRLVQSYRLVGADTVDVRVVVSHDAVSTRPHVADRFCTVPENQKLKYLQK